MICNLSNKTKKHLRKPSRRWTAKIEKKLIATKKTFKLVFSGQQSAISLALSMLMANSC